MRGGPRDCFLLRWSVVLQFLRGFPGSSSGSALTKPAPPPVSAGKTPLSVQALAVHKADPDSLSSPS